MKPILEKFQFHIEHPTEGTMRVWPNNNSLEFVYRREEKQIFYRKHLETELNFVNDAIRGYTDFDTFYELDRSGNRCSEIPLTITRFPCSGNTEDEWPIEWQGNIALVDASEFDVDLCIIRVKPRMNDQYECVFEHWEDEVNVLEVEPIGGEKFWVKTEICHTEFDPVYNSPVSELFDQNFAVIDLSFVFNTGFTRLQLPNFEHWSLVDNKVTWIEQATNSYTFHVTSIWQCYRTLTEIDNGTPIDPGQDYVLIDPNYEFEGETYALWQKGVEKEQTMPPQGRSFPEIIQKLVEKCGYKLESYILNYGGIGDRPENNAYLYSENNLQDLRLYQISDLTRFFVDEDATIANLTLKDLLEDLAELNIFWMVDENDNFILEHVTYFLQDNRMLNLATQEAKRHIQGRHNYRYVVERLPRKEEYFWSVSGERDFKKGAIHTRVLPLIIDTLTPIEKNYSILSFDVSGLRYPSACSTNEANTEHRFGSFVTNLTDVLEFGDNYPEDTLVLVAGDNQGNIITYDTLPGSILTPEIRTSRLRVNAALTMVELISNLIRDRRPHENGTIKDIDFEISLTNAQRLREQDEISIPMCCNDLVNTFDPADLVRTQLGWGEVQEATLLEPESELKLKLLFR